MNYSRRDFVTSASALVVGLPKLSSLNQWLSAGNAKISVQLYTVRDQIKKDLPGTLAQIRAAGFEYVETAFWPEGVSLQQAADALKQAALKVVSAHVPIPIGKDKDIFLETAAAMHCNRLIWHGWPEDKRYSSLEGTKELISIYNEAGKFAKEHQLQFGLHNHWWEYRNQVGGKLVYEWLLEGVSPDVFFEMDTYWVTVAGQKPELIIPKFGKRVKEIHIKDGPAKYTDALVSDKPDTMTALGEGKMNVPALLKAANPFVDTYIIEMDVLSESPFEVIKRSRLYLEAHLS